MYEEEKDDHPSNIGAHIRGSLSQSVYGKCATSLQYEILWLLSCAYQLSLCTEKFRIIEWFDDSELNIPCNIFSVHVHYLSWKVLGLKLFFFLSLFCTRKNSKYWILFGNMRNFVYEYEKISYIDYFDLDFFNIFLLDNAMKMLEYSGRIRYSYKIEKKRLSEA